MRHPDTLVIFDYSGTLSLEMPRFARPASLLRALEQSGLAALGVTGPKTFWEEIVNPTWVEGSTTNAGYRRVMTERIAALGLAKAASAGETAAAADRFVESYLDQSRIAPGWRPLLTRLSENPAVVVIIATDHYAETTARIGAELEKWGITAEPVDAASPGTPEKSSGASFRRPVIIANSADVGAWKTERAFWKALKKKLPAEQVRRVLVVDDLGFNEAAGDVYGGGPAKTAARSERMRANIEEVFSVDAQIIPFLLGGDQAEDEPGGRLIAETVLRIERFLEQQ